MRSQLTTPLIRHVQHFRITPNTRTFATSKPQLAKNRIFDPVRSPSDLDTLILLHTTRTAPLLTLWTGTWSRHCAELTPLLKSLIENEYIGLEQGGVGFAEVEMDAPTIGDVAMRYGITAVPTLLAFSRGEPQLETVLTGDDSGRLWRREELVRWIETEARRGGKGGAGGKWFGGLFGS